MLGYDREMATSAGSLAASLEGYRDAWCGADPAAVALLFTPDGERVEAGFDRVDRGRAAIEAAARELMSAFPVREVAVQPLLVDDVGWVAEVVWRGVHRGTFRGLPPTGRTVEIPGLSVARLDGGLLASERWYFDGQALVHLIGGRL